MNDINILKRSTTNGIMRRTTGKALKRGSHKSVFKRARDSRSEFLKTLESKREEIYGLISRLIENRDRKDAFLSADEIIEEFDRAAREIETQKIYGIVERKSDELKKIESLIKRISTDADFGRCEDCGRRIPAGRLMVMPEATRCVPCQQKTERWDFSRKSGDRKPSPGRHRLTSDWDEGDVEESAQQLFMDTAGEPILIEDFEDLDS